MTILQRAEQFFKITFPCTESQLKSAFRAAAKKLHSDVGGTDEAFIEMKRIYDSLLGAPEILSGHTIQDRTFSGELLSDLGLGLGPTVNGRDCPRCEHRGYTVSQESKFQSCVDCNGSGAIFICRSCQGTGQYVNPVKRKVPCRACGAKGFRAVESRFGIFQRIPNGAVYCRTCIGTGHTKKLLEIFTYFTCGECNGAGEIKIYNPVILKGSLSQKQRKTQANSV